VAGENCIMESFRICIARQMLSVDQIGKDEMGGACGLRERDMKGFGWKT